MSPSPVRPPQLFEHPATVPALLAHAAAAHGATPLVVTPERRLTYAEVELRSAFLARRLLRSGVGKGTRVGVLLPQGPEWVITFLAVARIGALTVTISTLATPAEIVRTLRHSDVALLLTGPRAADGLAAAVPGLAGSAADHPLELPELPYLRAVWTVGGTAPAWATTVDLEAPDPAGLVPDALLRAVEGEVVPADAAAVVSTSGTTSDPKGVVHTHGAIVRHGANLARLRWQPGDVTLALMPFFWIGGLVITLLPAMHTGSTLLTVERFAPADALAFMERERASAVIAWFTLHRELFTHPDIATRHLPRVRPNLMPTPGHPVGDPGLRHNSLGMTETCGPHSTAHQDHQQDVLPEAQRGSFGPAVEGVERRITDPDTGQVVPDGVEGELCVRGYSVTVGIYKRERADTFDADGWYRTGDRAVLRDGLVFFTGRISDLIKTKGANVAPAEVERALMDLDEIGQAFVTGLPHPELEEEVAAVVVLAPGAQLDRDALRPRLAEALASYKIPRRMVVVEPAAIPYLGTGKVDKRALAALAGTGTPLG